MADLAPSSLNLFQLLRPIGRGAMGEVWLAEHRGQRARVAIKLLHLAQSQDEGAAEALFTEVRAQTLLAHSNIVSLLDHGTVDRAASAASGNRFRDGSPFLVMEFVPGHALQTRVGRMPWPEARSVLLQLLDALAHSHARGIVHRDLKPGNVLLRQPSLDDITDAEVVPKITDFGVAQALNRGAGETREIVGTPSYMAPEQLTARWRDQGPWTDLYSLGCLAWSLVTGAPPFGRGRSFVENRSAHLNMPPPRLQPAVPVPEGFEEWLRRLLEKKPQDRFVRAADAAAALAALTGPARGGAPGANVPLQALRLEDADATVAEDWRSPRPPALPPQLVGVGLNLYELHEPPLIGREDERTAMWSALREVAGERSGRAVVLQGPSGAGTTRLATWLARRAHETGAAIVLEAWHAEDDADDAGVLPMLARHLRLPGLDAEERTERLAQLLPDLGMPDEDDARAIATLLAPPDEDAQGRAEIHTGEADERIPLALRLLRGIAAGPEGPRPLLLVLDDAHWSSDALALTRAILDARDPVPVLVVLTTRTDALSSGGTDRAMLDGIREHPAARVVRVGPLPADQHAELVRQLLGMEGGLAERVARRTAGNPYFAVQLVGDWVRRGVLCVGERGFELVPGARVDLPDDLRHAWRDRVEALVGDLPGDEQRALELAAVLGNQVDPDEWAAACRLTRASGSDALVQRLVTARAARLSDGDGRGWRFAHPMFRETIQVRARENRRLPRLHLACARALQERGAKRPGVSERLGRHLLMAGEAVPATHALLRAAEERLAQRQLAQVERLLDVRAETLRRLGTAADDPLMGEGPVLRCRLLRVQGRLDEAQAVGEAVLAESSRAGWRSVQARALSELSELARARGALKDAWKHITEAEPLARLLNDADLLARVRRKRGRLALLRGELELAEELLLKAREVFLRTGDAGRAAGCLRDLAGVADQQGFHDEAARRGRQAVESSEAAGDRAAAAAAVALLGDISRHKDELDDAFEHYSDAEARFHRAGMPPLLRLTIGRALVRRAIAGAKRAGPALESALAHAERSHDRPATGILHVLLLETAAARGDRGGWEDHMAAARVLLVESGRIDLDLALAAESAAAAARKAGWDDAARRALGLALVQFTKLGRPDDVARCKAAMQG